MIRTNRKLLCLIGYIYLCLASFAQESLGLNLSNYSPANAVQLNPALIADSRTMIDIHLAGGSFYGVNDHTYFAGKGPGLLPALMGKPVAPIESSSKGPRSGYIDAAVDGPGLFMVLGRNSVGISTRYRAMFRGENVSNELSQFIHHGFRHWSLYDKPLQASDMTLSFMTWGEVNLSYAYMLDVTDDHHVNVGLTVKRLFGQDHVGFRAGSMDYMFTSDNLYIENLDGGYALGSDKVGLGNGFAMDVGLIYRKTINGKSEYVPYSEDCHCKKSRYRYQLGVSVLDMGKVNFKQNAATVALMEASSFWPDYIDTEVSSIDELNQLLEQRFETDQNQFKRTNENKMALPSALSVQFDYDFNKGFHLGAILQERIKRGGLYDLWRARYVGIVPRYEKEKFELAVPMSFYEYQRLQMGLALRYQFVSLGSDDLTRLIADRDMYGADIYMNVRIPIYNWRDYNATSRRAIRKGILPCWEG
jgi:hypothetical protein